MKDFPLSRSSMCVWVNVWWVYEIFLADIFRIWSSVKEESSSFYLIFHRCICNMFNGISFLSTAIAIIALIKYFFRSFYSLFRELRDEIKINWDEHGPNCVVCNFFKYFQPSLATMTVSTLYANYLLICDNKL